MDLQFTHTVRERVAFATTTLSEYNEAPIIFCKKGNSISIAYWNLSVSYKAEMLVPPLFYESLAQKVSENRDAMSFSLVDYLDNVDYKLCVHLCINRNIWQIASGKPSSHETRDYSDSASWMTFGSPRYHKVSKKPVAEIFDQTICIRNKRTLYKLLNNCAKIKLEHVYFNRLTEIQYLEDWLPDYDDVEGHELVCDTFSPTKKSTRIGAKLKVACAKRKVYRVWYVGTRDWFDQVPVNVTRHKSALTFTYYGLKLYLCTNPDSDTPNNFFELRLTGFNHTFKVGEYNKAGEMSLAHTCFAADDFGLVKTFVISPDKYGTNRDFKALLSDLDRDIMLLHAAVAEKRVPVLGSLPRYSE